MTGKISFFDSIILSPKRKKIFSHLGYRNTQTWKTPATEKKVNAYIAEAVDLIGLKGSARYMDIKCIQRSSVVLQDNIILKSKDLVKFLKQASQVLLMAATVDPAFMAVIQQRDKTDSLTRAVVFDAVASEMVDDALNWITSYFIQDLKRQHKQLDRRRFSVGYGDFPLSDQKIFYHYLQLKNLKVKINKQFLLDPEKTVTAISGIYHAE